mmetsp:Transcript_26929/g.88060  ORF Transcript_26929/g.88060 Transcript_26929/m.88060 type:complete len:402 (-) Transcript_26929:172-1377(-)
MLFNLRENSWIRLDKKLLRGIFCKQPAILCLQLAISFSLSEISFSLFLASSSSCATPASTSGMSLSVAVSLKYKLTGLPQVVIARSKLLSALKLTLHSNGWPPSGSPTGMSLNLDRNLEEEEESWMGSASIAKYSSSNTLKVMVIFQSAPSWNDVRLPFPSTAWALKVNSLLLSPPTSLISVMLNEATGPGSTLSFNLFDWCCSVDELQGLLSLNSAFTSIHPTLSRKNLHSSCLPSNFPKVVATSSFLREPNMQSFTSGISELGSFKGFPSSVWKIIRAVNSASSFPDSRFASFCVLSSTCNSSCLTVLPATAMTRNSRGFKILTFIDSTCTVMLCLPLGKGGRCVSLNATSLPSSLHFSKAGSSRFPMFALTTVSQASDRLFCSLSISLKRMSQAYSAL